MSQSKQTHPFDHDFSIGTVYVFLVLAFGWMDLQRGELVAGRVGLPVEATC